MRPRRRRTKRGINLSSAQQPPTATTRSGLAHVPIMTECLAQPANQFFNPSYRRQHWQAYLFAGSKRHELDVRRRHGVVSEGPLDGVEVVRPDGHEGAAAADVLVQLVLRDADNDKDKDTDQKKRVNSHKTHTIEQHPDALNHSTHVSLSPQPRQGKARSGRILSSTG